MIGYVYMLQSKNYQYIGRTLDLKRRMRRHRSSGIIKEYGEMDLIILHKVSRTSKISLESVLNDLEYDEIIKRKPNLNKRIVKDYVRNRSMSVESCNKMSKSKTGVPHSKESIAKRSGKNAYQGKSVYSKKLDKKFDTLREAGLYAGLTKSGGCKISECIKGLRKSAGHHPITKDKIDDWEYI